MSEIITLPELLIKAAGNDKGIHFITSGAKDQYLPYCGLYFNALKVLAHMQESGVKQGDEVILQFRSQEQFLTAFWACILGGMIAVPVSYISNNEQLLKIARIWSVLKCPHFLADEEIFSFGDGEKLEEEWNEVLTEIADKHIQYTGTEVNIAGKQATVHPDDIGFIQFSSGSTGTPKGVTLTHANLICNIHSIITGCSAVSGDMTFSWMPLTHDMGMIGFHLTPMMAGMNQGIMPTFLFIKRPDLWLEKVSQYQANILSSPNFGYKHFLNRFRGFKSEVDLSHVRLIFNGAEPISIELAESFLIKLESYGLKAEAMFPVYGLAEASLAVTFPPQEEQINALWIDRNTIGKNQNVTLCAMDHPSAVSVVDLGFPVENTMVMIVGSDDSLVEDSVIGQICIKGDNVTKGYYACPEINREVITSDGWLKTGDLGFVKDGRLYITGREKDVLFVNGQNFYAFDIERVGEEVPGCELGKLAAVGVFNKETQLQEIVLFVQIKKRELGQFPELVYQLKSVITAKMGAPISDVVPVSAIPKTTSGKFKRFQLKNMYESSVGTPTEEMLM